MSETKPFWKSKINLVALAATLIALGDFVSKYEANTWDWKTVVLFIFGIGTVVLRTYFTTTNIK